MKNRTKPVESEVEDLKLSSAGQMAIRALVQALPEEPVSMAWRSSLNEQLLATAAKQRKKRRILWFGSPVAGLTLVTALAFVVMFQPTKHVAVTSVDRGVESAILSDHHTATLTSEVSTAGLNLNEVTNDANESDPVDGIWSESDVESL